MGGVVTLVVGVDDVVDDFCVDGGGVEIFPGAGGKAVFRELRIEVGIFPAGGGEAVFDTFWGGLGFLPENGAGAVLVVLGVEAVVCFLDGKTLAVGGIEGLLGCP